MTIAYLNLLSVFCMEVSATQHVTNVIGPNVYMIQPNVCARCVRVCVSLCVRIVFVCVCAVSYTHLDVYKRQERERERARERETI